jgi:predicted TIM-barrel fold metal-dependent hydrolase
MFIVDAHIHLWEKGQPRSAHRQMPYSAQEALKDMQTAGVDAAIIQPPAWDPDANEIAIRAATQHPHRFGILGNFPLESATKLEILHHWKNQTGMLGLRYILNEPKHAVWLTGHELDWLWLGAQEQSIPIAIAASAHLPLLGPIAKRHPRLNLIIDHLGVSLDAKGEKAFSHLQELLELATHPNVAIKATAVPSYANDPYPYPGIQTHLRSIFNAFGADRFFWGSDITKLNCTWLECVELFTLHSPWMKSREIERVMGAALLEYLNWKPLLK